MNYNYRSKYKKVKEEGTQIGVEKQSIGIKHSQMMFVKDSCNNKWRVNRIGRK